MPIRSMHWLTLQFTDRTIEHEFARASLPRLARQGLLAVWMGIAVYAVHGFILELVLPAEQQAGLWHLRLTAMLVPLLVLVLRPTRWFHRHAHWGLSMVGFAAGWGLIAMQLQCTSEVAMAFYPLIVEVAFYTYNFVGARFIYALGTDLTLLLTYNLVFGLLRPYPLATLLGHDFFLVSANLIGGTAGYLSERYKRLLYLQALELKRIQSEVQDSAAEQARVAERTRLLQDMHDGVGSNIGFAIRQLQSPTFSRAEVLATLQESFDQLKMTVDAMRLEAGDITALLAALRYRLEPRMRSKYMEIRWEMELLPRLDYLSVDDMRQLQFVLYEALSNAMQHSRASTLLVRAETDLTGLSFNQGVSLYIIDNGVGFDTDAHVGSGLMTMQERARRLGAQVRLTSAPGATCVGVHLPLRDTRATVASGGEIELPA